MSAQLFESQHSRRRLTSVALALSAFVGVAMLWAPSAALALSGASSSGAAAIAQYPTSIPPTTLAPTPVVHVQATTQTLPFTGYALIAVVPIALIMLSLGLALRRRASHRA